MAALVACPFPHHRETCDLYRVPDSSFATLQRRQTKFDHGAHFCLSVSARFSMDVFLALFLAVCSSSRVVCVGIIIDLAASDSINEVTIFFHDRLLRACRATKVNTHRLLAFDSPNQDPLATIGITIDENEHLVLPPPRGSLRVHAKMDTRLLTLRLIPGFDDWVIADMIHRAEETRQLRALVLQLYGTGNLPSVKQSFIELLAEASMKGILVVASTQCHTGYVIAGS